MSVIVENPPSHAHAAHPAVCDDLVRTRIVRLIFLFYWLLVFEGALRKWGIPQLEQALFFVRVPVGLTVYWMALVHRRWPRTNGFLLCTYVLAAMAFIWLPFQFVVGGYDSRYLLLAGYGWMNYFFYIPLGFVIAEQFRVEDLQRLTRLTAWFVIAAAPLVAVQLFSPTDSIVNLGSGSSASHQFATLRAVAGIIRPTGFFTSSVAQALFVSSAAALLIAAFLQRRRQGSVGTFVLWAGLGAVAVQAILGQSRTLFFLLGLVLMAAAVAGVLTGKRKALLRAAVWPVILVVTAGLLWPLLFPTAFHIFISRWTEATGYESNIFELGTVGRILYGFYAFAYHIPETPFFGYFLGIGGNASSQLGWVQFPAAATAWQGYGYWSEDAWSRQILDLGPLLGLCYIAFRVALTTWLGITAARATKRSGDVLPAILFGFIGIILLTQFITGNGVTNGFAWFYLGVCLAASRLATRNADIGSAHPK